MSRCLRGVPGLALVAALVLPCAAQAAQKDVSLGPPVSAQKALQTTGSDVNDFFPHGVTIHVGDKVRFVPVGFHTVDLPGRRGHGAAADHAHRRRRSRARSTPRERRSGSTARRSSASTPLLLSAVRQDPSTTTAEGGPQRPAARQQAQADDGQVHARPGTLHVLLRRPSRHDRHRPRRRPSSRRCRRRAGRRAGASRRRSPRRCRRAKTLARRRRRRRTRSTSARRQGRRRVLRHSSRATLTVPAGQRVKFRMTRLDRGAHGDVRARQPGDRPDVVPRRRSRRRSRAPDPSTRARSSRASRRGASAR